MKQQTVLKYFLVLAAVGASVSWMTLATPEVMAKSKWNPLNFAGVEEKAPDKAPSSKNAENTEEAETVKTKTINLKPAESHLGAEINTSQGKIVIELFKDEAPVTVKNFTKLVNEGFYNTQGMVFHRVVPGFVVQTGDPTGTGYGGSKEMIPLEVKNKLSHNEKGIVSMARGLAPDTATSQFFITLAPQPKLDGKYAIFGRVISGIEVIDQINQGDQVYNVKLIDPTQVAPDSYQVEKKPGPITTLLHKL